ncbi:MAG TPA: CehA/McbA family metallohydrolase [Acidimicrobiales bacterium]|jgi:predicted metal-dependent phosphoesterase TrpH|nr:CehA/McbA family metallohydrolase [Acidimicrobiales bacterium]
MSAVSRRRFLQLTAGVGAVAAVPGLRSAALGTGLDGGLPGAGEWLAGDFHVHTTWSHDVWDGTTTDDNTTDPQDYYTLGWTPAEQIRNAELRGLHFVALTDHNRIRILDDPGYTSNSLVLVPGYEHSLSSGHAGVFLPDGQSLRDLFAYAANSDDHAKGFDGPDALREFAETVHRLGGAVVVNHPSAPVWRGDLAASEAFDAVEVWNTAWQSRTNTTRFVEANNHLSMQFWENNFLGGPTAKRKGITGGSDNHWRSTTAVQGVGQPTTWVYAADRSAAAVVEAVKAGRTFVSAQPPAFGGARLFMHASEDWAGGRATPVIPGGTVRPLGRTAVAIRVEGGTGHRLRLISSGMVVGDVPVVSPIAAKTFTVVLPEGGWLRAELYADPGYAMAAMTSPVYADALESAPTAVRQTPTTGAAVSYGSPLDIPLDLLQEHVH